MLKNISYIEEFFRIINYMWVDRVKGMKDKRQLSWVLVLSRLISGKQFCWEVLLKASAREDASPWDISEWY